MIDDNITAATCEFGLAQTDGGACDVTFASFDPDSYLRSQIIYLAVGVLSVVATGFMYWRAVRFDCAKLQQYSLLLSAYASLTFVLRSADPNSYRHKIPHPVVCYFSDSCTAALYSVFILSLSYWASVIQRGAAHIQRPLELACFEAASIALVWLFYLVVDMLLFTTKGFFKPVMTYVQMGGSAGVLTLIGAAFLVYGVRVRNRLCHFERQKQLFEQRHLPYSLAAATQHLDPSNGSEPIDDNKELRRRRRASVSNSHAAKIVKILVVVDTLVVLAVGAQLYTAIARTTTRSSERDCANGFNCEDVHSSVNLMHWFQLAAIWIIVWLFRKIDKRTETPGTP